ncbi:L-seryl-tRNA(Sec) selenium transferase [Sporobacter termitidis]|uniref:L-seryl-tRNA(Sec) selenium transferase n=1 Tax=Sporobacter termitidis TaxID=44749 RepID=UPI001A9A5E23|nr:L-seryl-tRNA(Sec) selenium transferase [Sporobacter termitidis]
MNDTEKLLRRIPNVDKLMHSPVLAVSELPRTVVLDAVRGVLETLRRCILAGEIADIGDDEAICRAALEEARASYFAGVRPVINGTGVILHSNLGRACLSENAAGAAVRAAGSFSSLEYDLEAGERGSRTAALETWLKKLTGAEAALVVNNNAAAVLLILSAVAAGGEVVVSRGELVEIGGSFRVPEIMEQCDCRLREVGTTNKTRLSDYEAAVNENTRTLMKVHTSNFRVVGFTEAVSIESLAALGRSRGLPVIEDIGSGALVRMEKYGLTGEPFAADSLAAGADIVSFSGDKLLGGPQAGIILGKTKYLKLMKKHPLYRALRVDKMTVAALEETLRAYSDPDRAELELPVLIMLSAAPEVLREKAERLYKLLADNGIEAEVTQVFSTTGSGSVPGSELPSYAVSVTPGDGGAAALDRRLRLGETPVLGRIVKERYLLDVRTIFEKDIGKTAAAVSEAFK